MRCYLIINPTVTLANPQKSVSHLEYPNPNVVLSNVRELAGVLGKLGQNIALDWYLSVILAWMQHVHVSSVSSVKHIA